jgi:hypothetical protein
MHPLRLHDAQLFEQQNPLTQLVPAGHVAQLFDPVQVKQEL